MPRITLLTDFGTADGYVAAMKGVIASIAPAAVVEDAAHDLPPGDVHAAAWALGRYWRLYPPGTIHVVVVDPGVGSARRALAAEVAGRTLVAPDNGVGTWIFDEAPPTRVVAIENPAFLRERVSRTFHGRDVFAPAAAHLAAGVPLVELGPPLGEVFRLEWPRLGFAPDTIRGEVVHVDRFGNLITNVTEDWASFGAVRVAGVDLGRPRRTYADAEPGELLALMGSAGFLEVSVRDGSAAEQLGVGRGAPVEIRKGGTS
ncbi:MAG TPA: SAM-dependent chlorinase/fluorinase [Longimicrobiales bacterium]|nr:SAM-dependent chlorinase/fluorinase [Longimicrobiales bacterium]